MGNDDNVQTLGSILIEELAHKERAVKNEKQRRILALLAKGATLAVVLAAPRTATVFKDFLDNFTEPEEWKVFNKNYLRRSLRNLLSAELVEIRQVGQKTLITLSKKGETQIYKWAIESFSIPKRRWDGLWRLVIYDVLDKKKATRDRLRGLLEQAGFYRLQESIYLQAFPCQREVEFLRSYLGARAEVKLILAKEIENDEPFKAYFGIR